MGLHVHGFSKIKLFHTPCCRYNEDEPKGVENIVKIKENDPEFAEQESDLIVGSFYTYQDVYGFSAGPCSSYGKWRKWLSDKFLNVAPEDVWQNPDEYRDKPFFEIIHFTDCYGMLGPQACKNLLQDWKDHHEQVDFYGRFGLWTEFARALTKAAEDGDGCVSFG